MAGNTYGKLFRLTTFGESHGIAIGATIDGCPAGLEIDESLITLDMQRRKPGQSKITTQRKEEDEVQILSGIFEGKTTGTPIHLLIKNKDQRSRDYSHIKDKYRPSHADFTYDAKYGHRDYRGGGRSSARETAARVAAGAIAKMLLRTTGMQIQAYVCQVGDIQLDIAPNLLDLSKIESNIIRCPDSDTAEKMINLVEKVRKSGDTIGGVISCLVQGCPPGLGEPVFDKLHADLGKAMLSINAVKGFEIGSGFSASRMLGSEHNDAFYREGGQIKTKTNYSGGIQGGLSNGMDIHFKVGFKPVATIVHAQASVDRSGEETKVEGKGRHDPCVLPRAVPIVEAMAALTLADHYLRNRSSRIK